MRLLYISPYKYLKPSNGGQYCQYYTQQYVGDVSTLFVVSVQANEELEGNHFTLFRTFSNGRLRYINPVYFFKLKKLIQLNQIDVVVMEHPYYAWLGYLLKKSLRIQWIIRSANIEYLRFKSLHKPWWKLLKLYETWAHKQADYVWCITQEDKAQIASDIGDAKTTLVDFPYGTIETSKPNDKDLCRTKICEALHIDTSCYLILFNGSLNYTPNRIGLDAILNEINPVLQKTALQYKIIICGSKLPEEYDNLDAYKNNNIIYCGYVDDISLYFKGVDLFINPVIGGGGIKTKLVEALAYNTKSISSVDGAIGLYTFATGTMLHTVKDLDWKAFAEKIIEEMTNNSNDEIPKAYYEYYGWIHNVRKALDAIRI